VRGGVMANDSNNKHEAKIYCPKELTSFEQKIAFMQLPVVERRKILSEQAEKFIMENPDYYKDNVV
jgi:hypothetical protein